MFVPVATKLTLNICSRLARTGPISFDQSKKMSSRDKESFSYISSSPKPGCGFLTGKTSTKPYDRMKVRKSIMRERDFDCTTIEGLLAGLNSTPRGPKGCPKPNYRDSPVEKNTPKKMEDKNLEAMVIDDPGVSTRTDLIKLEPVRLKFINYEVTNENLHLAIRDLQLPFEMLRHFDEKRKANRKFLAPLKYFGFKTEKEEAQTIFNPENSGDEILNFKAKIIALQMKIRRKKEKHQNVSNIADNIAENLVGMTCETYYSLSTNISNLLWLFADAVKNFHNFLEPKKTVYNLCELSNVFEDIFYEGFKKLGEPNVGQLSGPNFLSFLKWRNICHDGPFLNNFGDPRPTVAINVFGKFECLKIFNLGKPLMGLFQFETKAFRNSENFEPLPFWYLNPPELLERRVESYV